MRLVALLVGLVLLGVVASIAGGCSKAPADNGVASSRSSRPVQEAVIDLSSAGHEQSHLGPFPPTEVVSPERFRSMGVKAIDRSLVGDGVFVETRRTPDGSFITQIGDALFLSQRASESSPSVWTLRVPPDREGQIRVVAVSINGRPGLGIERDGDFARLAWDDGDWRFVLFDVGDRWGVDRLVQLAESLR